MSMTDRVSPTGFAGLFGADPAIDADAPGRVNLIGEHTDYHGGFVLPTVTAERTRVQLRPRDDRRVRAWSDGVSDGIAEYELGDERPRHGWLDYIQGVTVALAALDMPIHGFDVRIESDVPLGAGLSSSAALEVSVLRALRAAFRLALDDVALAKAGQAVETEFVGAPIGIMDQMASSLGRDGEALFIDTTSLAFERIALPRTADVLVLNSGLTHAHAGGEYVVRRRESFEAARLLGVSQLRDVEMTALARVDALPPLLARRARHVVTENQRVLDAVAALRAEDPVRLGTLFNASHASMRDDYEVSVPDIDVLVALAQRDAAVFGARLTGGGFGGGIVALTHAGAAHAVSARVARAYETATGREARAYFLRSSGP
jgi:galactokinase